MTTKDEMQARIDALEAENAALRQQVIGARDDKWLDLLLGNADAYLDAPKKDDNGVKIPDRSAHTFQEGEVVVLARLPLRDFASDEDRMAYEDEIFTTVTHVNGFWNNISHGKPTWVACEDEDIAGRLSAWYRCPIKPMDEAVALLEGSGS